MSQITSHKRELSLKRDHSVDFPDLWLDVYLTGEADEKAQFAEMFARASCKRASSPETADLVVFAGGADVNPALYGEEPHESSSWDDDRDTADIQLYLECYEKGIPMLGICRGAQFLHVMNGGKLYQDVDNHYGDHSFWEVNHPKKYIKNVSSVHHQMVRPNTTGGMMILAESYKTQTRWKNDKEKELGRATPDIEAFFYRDSMCLGIQGHPEYRNYAQFAKWSLDQIKQYIIDCPDIGFILRNYRIKPEILVERENKNKIYVLSDVVQE